MYVLQILCALVVQLHTIQDKAVTPLTPSKYAVLNGNFVFDLCGVFQEPDFGVKRDLPVCLM